MLAIFFRLYDGKIYRTIYDVPALKTQPPIKAVVLFIYYFSSFAVKAVINSVLKSPSLSS